MNKAQGITAETSGILIGGWQTDKEHAYVTVSRAREQTQIYTSREDLGEMGLDTGAMERLAERMKRSRAQEASITKNIAEPSREAQAEREQARDRAPRRQRDTERRHSRDREIDEFLGTHRSRPHDRSDDDDFATPGQHDQAYYDSSAEPTNERVQADARDWFEQYQHEPRSAPVNIQDANPADIQLDVRDLGDIKLAYTQQPYDLQGYTGEPTYVLFGGWQTETEQGFVAVTQSPQGTDVQMSREARGERDIETELQSRVEQGIERAHAREAGTPESDREHQPNGPTQLGAGEPHIEHFNNAGRDPEHQPEREPVERDPYIEQAIQEERDRQQAFEQGIEQERENDLGFGIE